MTQCQIEKLHPANIEGGPGGVPHKQTVLMNEPHHGLLCPTQSSAIICGVGRPKKANTIKWEQSVKELLAAHDLNPLDELLKIATERIELKDGDEQFITDLMDDYELVISEGKKFLRPKLKYRIDIFSEVAQYFQPKLRSTETKGQVDYNFNLTIKQFGEDSPKRVDVVDVTPKLITDH
jgi:hypothetical protein